MTKAELIEILAERPFRPLLLHMTNGRTHEIHHPENAIVADDHLTLLATRDGEEVIRIVSLPDMTQPEPLPSSSS